MSGWLTHFSARSGIATERSGFAGRSLGTAHGSARTPCCPGGLASRTPRPVSGGLRVSRPSWIRLCAHGFIKFPPGLAVVRHARKAKIESAALWAASRLTRNCSAVGIGRLLARLRPVAMESALVSPEPINLAPETPSLPGACTGPKAWPVGVRGHPAPAIAEVGCGMASIPNLDGPALRNFAISRVIRTSTLLTGRHTAR